MKNEVEKAIEKVAMAERDLLKAQKDLMKVLQKEYESFSEMMESETAKAVFSGKDRTIEYMGQTLKINSDLSGVEIL